MPSWDSTRPAMRDAHGHTGDACTPHLPPICDTEDCPAVPALYLVTRNRAVGAGQRISPARMP
eukprot:7263585-Prymnesium_polylepis.2